jgi:hypothetical protein
MKTTDMEHSAASRRPSLLALLAGALLAALLAAPSGCSEEGETPTCVQDIDKNGHQDVQNGCNPFGLCVINNQVRPAEECCKGLSDGELQACLYGYGAAPAPASGAGGGGGGGGGQGGAGGQGGN